MILQPIDRNEALRYLGCKDGTDNEQMIAMLDSCEKQLLKAANPKYLYAVYPISFTDDGVRISDSNIILKGNSAAAHLKNCDRIVLMCATLGQGVDVLLRHLQVSDMASAVIVDSLAGAAIELKQRYSKKYARTAVHGDILPATAICPLIYSLIY